MKRVVIIGNGIAGVTAARYIRKYSDYDIQIISAESDHFYSRPALMYIYMGHMKYENTKPYEDFFWEKNRIDLVRDTVTEIDTDNRRLSLLSGRHVLYDVLIIASGSRPNKFGWPGQDLEGVQGLYSLQDLELMEHNTRGVKRGVIVGGGLIGIEVAEMLHSRDIPVTFLVREEKYWNRVLPDEESDMVTRHIFKHHVDLRLGVELQEILADDRGRVRAVKTSAGDEIECEFVALTAGVHPNIDFVESSNVKCGRGVLVNEFFETNIPDVYSIGDCAEIIVDNPDERNRLEQLWYTGRMHGEVVARTITGTRTEYDRGILFNSAKFFDIEYHTYGLVNFNTPGEKSLYWEHPDGERAIRIVYNDECVIGFNLMGIRYRHGICEDWIRRKLTIEQVLKQLHKANFDPEFYEQFEDAVINLYRQSNPDSSLRPRRKSGLKAMLFG